MARFTIATLAMVALLALALVHGGIWAVAALVYITAFTYFMDRIAALAPPDDPGQEFPAGDTLSLLLGVAHFPLLYGGVRVIGSSDAFTTADKILIFFALSLFLGQVSNSNAHELIHRAPRVLRRLGVAVYASILFGFHASAHVRVHHVHAATVRDPNSARLGESFYAFAPRAWAGALVAGYHAESRLRRGTGLHPYAVYGLGAALSLVLAYVLAGWGGIAALLGLSAYAQAQLLLSDYVQHYGLTRREIAPGRPEPVGPQHSWNAPHGFSSALMLNAPRHSDHHSHPAKPYPGLSLDRAAMPILPHSLPVMAVLALLPPVWRRVMDRRVARVRARQADLPDRQATASRLPQEA
ncbi:alkane 1-monooxygenase [Pseudoponticoccus marisrubri]|uniref:Alkane 1-monooxygenase n=1 Tax=Pseudoponticoccus marisrubri TaxID=1685382 RepID=A0A0W7WNA1_9RHOB|nr:alkane 1-monooxygenase [Pseudoponticoccus marisrubri]KUF12077.1 alkane 1-monooxygenase [Pseudoponticoccus marisrubri]